MLICPYLFHRRSSAGRFFSRRGYPYVVIQQGLERPIIKGSPNFVTIYLKDNEVSYENTNYPVTYIAVIDGELQLVDSNHPDVQAVVATYLPDSTEGPTNHFIELNLDTFGVRALAPELTVDTIDPLTGIVHPQSPYDPPSSRELAQIVSRTLRLEQTVIGHQSWALIRENPFRPPQWCLAFTQEHVRLADDMRWLTRILDKIRLSPGLQGPRLHCRYFESTTSEKSCVFGLHAENLSWWRTGKGLMRNMFIDPARERIETHLISSWHLGRDLLVGHLRDMGLTIFEEQVTASERIQGWDWDGKVVIVLWNGQTIHSSTLAV